MQWITFLQPVSPLRAIGGLAILVFRQSTLDMLGDQAWCFASNPWWRLQPLDCWRRRNLVLDSWWYVAPIGRLTCEQSFLLWVFCRSVGFCVSVMLRSRVVYPGSSRRREINSSDYATSQHGKAYGTIKIITERSCDGEFIASSFWIQQCKTWSQFVRLANGLSCH